MSPGTRRQYVPLVTRACLRRMMLRTRVEFLPFCGEGASAGGEEGGGEGGGRVGGEDGGGRTGTAPS